MSPSSAPNPNDTAYCRTLTVNEAAPPRPPTPNGSSAERNDGGVTSVAVSHDGRFMAAGSLDNIVRIWEIATGILVDRLRGHESSVYSVVFTPDGKGVVSGSLDMTMKLWDISPLYNLKAREVGTGPGVGRCVSEFRGHKVNSVASYSSSPSIAFWWRKEAEELTDRFRLGLRPLSRRVL
jgi:WD40 repeat protein